LLWTHPGGDPAAEEPHRPAAKGDVRPLAVIVEVGSVNRPAGHGIEAHDASIGVATLPGHGHDTQTLLRAVDRALYTAKANGRDLVETLQAETTPATSKDAVAA
jgi:GGDEF domain-containing protein